MIPTWRDFVRRRSADGLYLGLELELGVARTDDSRT
jgi:hypothetical protein